ncbi:hypothetical protein EI555_011450 [Monodon monoceros]|uniref:Uncharacterized protein n=1 Tax=Monodon monoceros TaxID=40151 RepID=A0A4U1FAK2_MONMO|nr:hypothetical protein EI555_011450 [Monodon monoceros]
MGTGNYTTVTEFIVLGLAEDTTACAILFIVFLGIHVVTLMGNVSKKQPSASYPKTLGAPSVTPVMLMGFLREGTSIRVAGCVAQLCSTVTFGTAECFLLAAMAYDCHWGLPIKVVTVFIIAFSYIYILFSILKMCSTEGRHKAFSACTSHLTAVTLFYGTITIIYVMPKSSYSTEQNKVVSVFPC